MTNDTQRGFTLIEVTVVLMALAILAAMLVPSIGNLNSLARQVRMKEDLGVLCSTLKMMLDDLGDSAFFEAASYGSGGISGAAFYGGGGVGATTTGRTTFEQRTEYVEDAWCEDCDMPASDCGPECMDDCGPDCYGRDDCGPDCYGAQRTAVTTQTYGFESDSSGAAYGGSSGVATSYRSGGSYAGGYGYGLYGFPLGLLVGDGDIPGSAIGATEWQLEVGSRFAASTHGYFPVSLQFGVGTFGNQLIYQDPTLDRRAASAGYGSYGSAYGGYGNYGRAGRIIPNRHFRWRGPYIADAVAPDPWGNRYMANVFALHAPPAHTYPTTVGRQGYVEGFTSATVCYSAGPNGLIETHFNQPRGWYTGGDDVTVVLAGAGGIR